MSYSSSAEPKSSNFCKLFGELAISYNGHLVECVPKQHSRVVGTILTEDGKVYAREECGEPWELVLTPAVFLFYDNKTNVTFEVDTCKESIKDLKPHGRILDATDKKIYEIKDSQWCPIYDFNSEEDKCDSHAGAACGGLLTAERLTGLCRGCATGANDEYYYYPVNSVPSPAEQTGVSNWRVGGFTEKVGEPCGQIVGGNSWVAPETADYDFHAVLTYQTAFDLIEDSGPAFDNFLLILTRNGKKVVVGRVPVNYDGSVRYDANTPFSARQVRYYLSGSGQVVFNQTLRLLKGDSLSIYLVSNLNGVDTVALPEENSPALSVQLTVPQIYLLDPLGTTISVHAVACVDECDVPALSTLKYEAPVIV